MNFIIQLPPLNERSEMVELLVEGFISKADGFEPFFEKLHDLSLQGYSIHGLNCFLLHETTQKLIKNKVALKSNIPLLDIALCEPLSLN